MNEEPNIILHAKDMGRCLSETGTWLYRNIDLTITAGITTSIIGRTGSGKSALLRGLIGLDRLDEGTIHWRGEPLDAARVPGMRRDIIYLHQTPAFVPGTVGDNLMLPYRFVSRGDRIFHQKLIAEYLNALELGSDFLGKAVSSLSGGERQIVALLRAIQLEPSVLLLDEPTGSLDTLTKATVETMVTNWYEMDTTSRSYIWISHDESQARRLGDRLFTICDGELLEGDDK